MDFNKLILTLSELNNELKEHGIRAVNFSLTLRNWFFGLSIFEFEQKGKDRAEYGKALLARIAAELKIRNIPNTDERELRRFRQFYLAYPMAAQFFNKNLPIRGLINPDSNISEKNSEAFLIRGITNPEFNIPDHHYTKLFSAISYSHFVELIRIDEPLMRLFYENECVKNTWSVKELKRHIGSLLYERTGLSKNKELLLNSLKSDELQPKFSDIIRDPYIFEFLGLKQSDVFREKELEKAILDHLQEFLLELGKGFCFEARQKRVLIDNEYDFIDLVFYHRILHCHVLIDLKMERFHHSHASQLNTYIEYYKKYEMNKGDNLPVGILLCSDKDQEHVEFATAGIEQKVFVSKYLVVLPDKKELELFIKNQLKEYER
ncbi:MAG: PDDEXK nuclease domain-containing protein [Bacteroidota bacterium]|nr:PDDEXK nuclease domain-containing protein [Bacteroidota bacterium]